MLHVWDGNVIREVPSGTDLKTGDTHIPSTGVADLFLRNVEGPDLPCLSIMASLRDRLSITF